MSRTKLKGLKKGLAGFEPLLRTVWLSAMRNCSDTLLNINAAARPRLWSKKTTCNTWSE